VNSLETEENRSFYAEGILDILGSYVMPQIKDLDHIFHQLSGEPWHFSDIYVALFMKAWTGRWIWRPGVGHLSLTLKSGNVEVAISSLAACLLPSWLACSSTMKTQYLPLKCNLTSTKTCWISTQKNTLLIVTAMRTSNLTLSDFYF
jgi:hypothetical protein